MPSQYIRVQPILPDPNFLTKKYNLTAMRLRMWLKGKAKRTMQNAMKETVDGWKEKPDFPGDYSEPYDKSLEMHVYAKGKGVTNWQRVSGGTGPRMIVSKKGLMKFQPGYDPKTTPAGRYGGPGSRSGPWRQARAVGPHRIEPREFSKHVKEKIEAQLIAEAMAILSSAIKEK